MRSIKLITIFLALILISCSQEARDINYGHENCSYCSMTIMDEQFGAETVTEKGKVFTYCSIECMGKEYLDAKKFDKDEVALMLCKDYESPDKLIEVGKMTFLISKQMPSPMGKYLNAFDSEKKALDYQNKNGGKVMTWEQVLGKL